MALSVLLHIVMKINVKTLVFYEADEECQCGSRREWNVLQNVHIRSVFDGQRKLVYLM